MLQGWERGKISNIVGAGIEIRFDLSGGLPGNPEFMHQAVCKSDLVALFREKRPVRLKKRDTIGLPIMVGSPF